MARAIDAEALEKKISEWLGQPGNGDYYSGYDAALCAVQDLIADTPTLTPPDKPLTLEQLREMDGQPVWIQNIEEPDKSQWRLCHWDRGKYLVLQGISVKGYLLEEYGESWLAYAYPPAHIDREAWEPCGECAPNCSWCKNNNESSRTIPKVCRECKHHSNYEPEYKFCCECGRPLTEEAWAELEKRMGVVR